MYLQLANHIKRAIILGELADGSILPSERKLADRLSVHRNTVIRAYEVLKDIELIESRQGKGYVVTCPMAAQPAADKKRPKAVNWSSLIKDEYLDFHDAYDAIYSRFSEGTGISFSTGMPPNVYPDERVGELIAEILSEGDLIPAFTTPYQGDLELIRQIREKLRMHGILAEDNQVQILSETNQALDFLLTLLTEPGDLVLIEEPCSPDVFRIMELSGCRFFTIPVDLDGMTTEHLEAIIEKKKPKFIYVSSSYQDPTGMILTMERRQKLIDISNRYRIPILEDDAASELHYEDFKLPSLKSMDRNNNVIYIYSFSLTFVPGISVACVIADEKIVRALRHLVSVRVIGINWLSQRLIAKCLKNGDYWKYVEEIVVHCRTNRDIMCAWLDKVADIGVQYIKPRGGVYIWVQLPKGISGTELAERALKKGVSIVPGNLYYPNQNGGDRCVRLNYSFESPEWLVEGMKRLTRLIWDMYKASKH